VAEFHLRPAALSDAPAIKALIRAVQINPMGLDWRRFIVAESGTGQLLGCGQIKPHEPGVFELASIAVWPEHRGKGIARAVIEELLERHPGRLYLMTMSTMAPLYEKFGFSEIPRAEMPRYFRRMTSLVMLMIKLTRERDHLIVMRRA
jgi:N-acetylglutamate synthase-like GNAT family acetyltransferase